MPQEEPTRVTEDYSQTGERENFSHSYRQIVKTRPGVAESAVSAEAPGQAPIREKLVRCLWFDQFLEQSALRIEDGQSLSVFSPGYWNQGSGPDFSNAELSFDDGPRIRGDVEVHVNTSGWKRHGHEKDPAYGRVVLHVVLNNDTRAPCVTHEQKRIPQLVLSKHLSADLSEILQSLDADQYPRIGSGREGTCCRSLRGCGRDEKWLARFLDIAGDERVLNKAERFERQMAASTPDKVFYEALMESMGYSANRHGFSRLARVVSLDDLKRYVPLDAPPEERRLVVESLLMGGAGFLDDLEAETADVETAGYLATLNHFWHKGPSQEISLLSPSIWQHRQTRPTNRPIRRLAGVSCFLALWLPEGLCRAMLTSIETVPRGQGSAAQMRHLVKELCALFESDAVGYWACRTAFGPKCLSRPSRLIGHTRAIQIIVNVVIPVLLALARRSGENRVARKLHNVYSSLRPVADNSIVRYMKARVFGDPEGGSRVVCSLRRQQGLLQVFHDFCESASMTCDDCGLLAAIEGRAG